MNDSNGQSGWTTTAQIEEVEWDNERRGQRFFAVSVRIAILADEFTGLDLTRPITITQDSAE